MNPRTVSEEMMRSKIQSLNISFLSNEYKERLNNLFSLEKVRTVSFQIGPLKDLGIDRKPELF